jgi:AcrR family transcriptional regulator
MNEFTGGKALIYKSDTIFERRRRILSEARKLISEAGFEGFSVRELCARAGIAQKTLYNAFGNKDKVIVLAIRQYMTDFNDRTQQRFDLSTLEGRLERTIKVHSRNIRGRPYAAAIMAVYNSPNAERAVREAIRDISVTSLQPFVEALAAAGELAPGMSAERFTYLLTTGTYAILSDWCLGDLADDQLLDRISEAFLVLVFGGTTGQTRQEAQRWLEDLRAARPRWLAMRKMAEVTSAELRAATRGMEAPPKAAKTARASRRSN